jgi:histidyl-tRNA synthetase
MIQLIRGFRDILPGDVELWQQVENTAVSIFKDFGFQEIRIPIMERTELFARSIGEDTDIVEREMYTFPDRKGDLVTLRPEATASIVRAYIQHKLYAQDPVQKLYTIGPMFRRERPQKGRYRQFYQINAEVFGIDSPLMDVQLILMLVTLLSRLSVKDAVPHINSLGCLQCRPHFKAHLSAFLATVSERLCSDCIRRSERSPLRVLDCKVETCRDALKEAPSIVSTLCPDCKKDFDIVEDTLDQLAIPFKVDKRLVRGLDYYTRTTFEIQTGSLGAQNAVAGGGRYDGLVKALGGPDLPATGFAVGLDRLAEIVGLAKSDLIKTADVYIAALGEKSILKAFEWACALGRDGIRIDMDFGNKSLKSQMKRAGKTRAQHVLIVGEKELEQQAAILRNMSTKKQQQVPIDHIIENIQALMESIQNKQ